jgi:thymidylate kinase
LTAGELINAAKIADPFGETDLSGFSAPEIESAARTLVRHKVSLLGLRKKYGAVIDTTPLAGHVETDQRAYDTQRDEFERIRVAFLEDGVDAMLFKSTGLYPSFHYLSSNLDVLVPETRVKTARRRLVDMEYVELVNVEEPKKFLFRRFPGDGTSYTFHLHAQVGWGVPFLESEPLWRNARRAGDDPDILIPGPVEALLVTTAHWFYEDKSLSLGNLLATAYAVKNLDRPLEIPGEVAGRRGWAEGYWAALRVFDDAWERLYGDRFLDEEQYRAVAASLAKHTFVTRTLLPRVSHEGDDVASIPFLRNKLVYYRKIMRDPARSTGRRVRDFVATLLWAVRWKLHLRSQKPMLVTISGCDGSGKTLQAQKLKGTFDTCDIRARVVWARGASSRFMGMFIRLAKKIVAGGRGHDAAVSTGGIGDRETAVGGKNGDGTGGTTDDLKMAYRRRSLQNPFFRFIFGGLYALDLSWTYHLKTRLLLLSGYVVITDRYVYDSLVDYALFSGGTVGRSPAALKWLLRFAPRPDVGIVLDVEPSDALGRKPEEGSTGHLADARREFKALAVSQQLKVITAGQPPEAVQRSLSLMSLRTFYDRYGTVINWLLCSNPRQLNPPQEKD